MSVTGTFTSGTINIPVVTGNIVITAYASIGVVTSISAVYTQSGTVYDTDTLDSLRNDLVVTATYEGGTTGVVTTYTLYGTLTAGTSTVTVSYGGKTTTFTVTVSEHWSYSISDLTKVTGAFVTEANADCGVVMSLSDTYRRSFYLKHGVTSVATKQSGNIISQTSDYYPIKVPEGATECTISITPNTQFIGATLRSLANGVYTAVDQPGYRQGTSTFTIAGGAPNNYWMFITTKYNSAGTSYPTQPSALDVTFSGGTE